MSQFTPSRPIPSPLTAPFSALQQSVTVTFDYQVHFTFNLFDCENDLLRDVLNPRSTAKIAVESVNGAPISDDAVNHEPVNCIVVVDGGLLTSMPDLVAQIQRYADHHRAAIRLKVAPLVIAGGEAIKNDPNQVQTVQQLIHAVGLCRHSYVVAIGGGALLDMAGYAAATAHRGIRLLRVPTTVLAQDDSGVGVKNGVNAFGKKNFLGTFSPPDAVINDAAFLLNLPQRDWIAGIAEAVKVALIKDAPFFDWICQHAAALVNRDLDVMQQLIYRSCQHHLTHIGTYGDPFEMGSSRPLDFGHWSAHRLEHLTHYRLRHGEAVAIGMALDSTYSFLIGELDKAGWNQILSLLDTLGFALTVPELTEFADVPMHPQSVFSGLHEFREHLGGELTLMLLRAIGQGFEVHQVDIELYQQAIRLLETIARPQTMLQEIAS
ncbi:3-dehydroquinate synthase [filamentous cyanobacterium LEGE 11480]|uniref:3-dehydroquinate synthase n=1 Tax=Romeriopsis navalis LEGE 11480 TaxID=2777977 RepID=A0A928Z355_9CYAN|nr:3-dehydroquinate synthase [Romeriopsis navalis]MBE9028818.1 3-dehydroquinate synthase [Romeriopsis navalis LEGE 11480]